MFCVILEQIEWKKDLGKYTVDLLYNDIRTFSRYFLLNSIRYYEELNFIMEMYFHASQCPKAEMWFIILLLYRNILRVNSNKKLLRRDRKQYISV